MMCTGGCLRQLPLGGPGPDQQFREPCLSYGIFASASTNFFPGVIYETNPNGYLRDKPLLDRSRCPSPEPHSPQRTTGCAAGGAF